MLHELLITNVRLTPCSVGPEQLTPTAQGHYCQSCDREVVDFTTGTAADVLRAQTAAPDGRVCGRFYLSQLAPESRPQPPRLRHRLRQFLLVAVLVLVQGLTAREAWAQVRPAATEAPNRRVAWHAPFSRTSHVPPEALRPKVVAHGGVEKMPVPPGGVDGLTKFLGQHLRPPGTAAGKVFVSFVVKANGQPVDFKVVRGLDSACDAEALRVLRLMPAWTPGEQNGHSVAVRYTLPITFTLASEAPKQRRR